MTLRPGRVVKELNDVTMIEVMNHGADGGLRLAGFFVYGGFGDSSVLHEDWQTAEDEFFRRALPGTSSL